MVFLLVYLLVNTLISVSLERRKLRSATVFHTAAFALIALLLLLVHGNGSLFEALLEGVLPSEVYGVAYRALVVKGVALVAPLMAIEWVVSLSFLIFGAVEVVSILIARKKAREEADFSPAESRRFFEDTLPALARKIYRMQCRMRC